MVRFNITALALVALAASTGCSDQSSGANGSGGENNPGGSSQTAGTSAGGHATGGSATAGAASGGGGAAGATGGTGPGAAGTGGRAGSGGAGGSDLPPNCQELPSLPAAYTVVQGVAAAEDLVFDKSGFVWTVINGNLMKAAYGEPAELVIPGLVGMESAGTRMLVDETLIVADVSNNEVVAVTKAGGKDVLASGMSYPNGVAVGHDGLVYVAEQSGKRVVRIDPVSKSSEVLAEDLINPNGLAFSPDHRTLYVSSFIGGMIYQIVFDEQGKPAPVTVLAEKIGKDGHGGLDGVGVDACGNVYVTEFSTANVWRITPEGKITLAVDLSSETSWIPNLSWGSGVGGWDPKKMYVIDRGHDQVFAVEIGVGSAGLPHL